MFTTATTTGGYIVRPYIMPGVTQSGHGATLDLAKESGRTRRVTFKVYLTI